MPFQRREPEPSAVRALAMAETVALRRGLRLTSLRHYVLEMLLASGKPLGAYELLAALAREDDPAKPSPPTVYRALDFLIGQGFVHRLASRNAFLGCVTPGVPHRPQFLICRGCGRADERTDEKLERALDAAAGFRVEEEYVELCGLCEECAGQTC